MLSWLVYTSWKFWLFIIVIAILILWVFSGGKKYPFVGIDPHIYDTRYVNSDLYSLPEIDNNIEIENNEDIDYEPCIKNPEPAPKKEHRSRGEAICCQVMEDIFNVPFTRIRPDFLKNPETGYNLEIDCYNDDLKIGVEYNGIQHYVYPNYTGQSYEDFIKQVRRDQFKVYACDKAGVYLITVPHNVPEHLIKDYITYYLPENVQRRQYQPSE